MSFKRDGDDASLLRNLQQRRVADLLAVHIPDDEAMLLKNGRYTCTVCFQRPIFDTLDILAAHRGGKKHLANLSKFLAQQDLKCELLLRRKQDSYNKTGNASNCLPKTSNAVTVRPKTSVLLKSSAYNSCCKRRRKPTDRKLILDTGNKQDHGISSQEEKDIQSKDSANNKLVDSYLRKIKRKVSFETKVEKLRVKPSISATFDPNIEKNAERPTTDTVIQEKCGIIRMTPTADQMKKESYLLNLRRDGWKQTLDGKWVKDEDAEFDSDEETPPICD